MPSFAKSLSLHRDIQPFAEYAVTPFVGVWIETLEPRQNLPLVRVTPFVGVWIETELMKKFIEIVTSHPSWVCGLKPFGQCQKEVGHGVTPFVGVWIETCPACQELKRNSVTPFVGVWIETYFKHLII